MMPIQFIDNRSAIDHATRKRIRSHVAMGRNVGKTIVRRSKTKAHELRVKTTLAIIHTPKVVRDQDHEDDLVRKKGQVLEVEQPIGDWLSILSFEQKNIGSRKLVQLAFQFICAPRHAPELSNALDTTGNKLSIWYKFMFIDEAYFHCAVAMSIMALNNLLVTQVDPVEALHHLSHMFRLVNERLSSKDTISDSTIAVVVSMAQYWRLQRQLAQGIVHVEALQRMVKLRGGIAQLTKEKIALCQKIFRADLEYSLYLGSATRFGNGDIELSSTAIVGLPNIKREYFQRSASLPNAQLFGTVSADLQNHVIDITSLAWLVNDAAAGRRPKLNPKAFHDTLLLLGYHIVNFSPLGGPRPTNYLENAIHLGLTMFITTFLQGLDYKMADGPLLYKLAFSAAQERYIDNKEEKELLLWILFIGAASVFKEPDNTWLIPKTRLILDFLCLDTWDDVYRTLVKFPWVHVTHDKAGQALWHKSTLKAAAE